MCGFTFAVFFSVFELVPTAAFRIRDLGGGPVASGLFTGCLTFASAVSAPITGAYADRIGRRKTLVVSSTAVCVLTLGYAATTSYIVMLALVIIHGLFWSGLMSASGAYLTGLVPERRRAEGIAYWGLTTVLATAVAPPAAFWLFDRGGWLWICLSCGALNLTMAGLSLLLTESHMPPDLAHIRGPVIESRVLWLAGTLFLCTFGYGAITTFSALYADALHVTPKSIFLTALGATMLVTRPFSGRVADRFGYRRVLLPCLVFMTLGLALLSASTTRVGFVWAAFVFGVGFGTAYPVFVAYVMRDIDARRRGAAFGAILAAFDTGIGSGSIASGWLIQRMGFPMAFGMAAALSATSLPYFLVADRRWRRATR
jgi:MFS family permease